MPDTAVNDSAQEILEFVIRLKIQELTQGLSATEQQIKDFDDKAKKYFNDVGKETDELNKKGKQLNDDWTRSLKSMESAASSLARTSGVAFGAVAASGGLAVKTFADYESQMNTLQAVSGASAAEMDKLNAKNLELGNSTKFSASQMAGTSVELAKLGFVSDEIVDSIDGIVAAAAASGESLQDAGELVAGTVRGFNLEAKEASRVADILAQSANSTALSMGDISLSMKYIAPVAAASNQSLTDMTAALGALANNMIKGEQAGTSLRTVIQRIQTKDAADQLEKLGIKVSDAQGKIKHLPQIIGELQKALAKYSDETKNRKLGELFGMEAVASANVLLKTGQTELEHLSDQLDKSAGAAKHMSDIMEQGVTAELTKLKSKAEGVAISFGQELAPAAESVIKFLQNILDVLQKMPEPAKKTAAQITALAGAVSLLGLALGGAVVGGSKLVGLFEKLGELGTKLPWLAPLLTGSAGLALGAGALAVGGGILVSNLQGAANDLNAQAADADTQRTIGSGAQAISKINSLLSKEFRTQSDALKKAEQDAIKTLSGSELDKALQAIHQKQKDLAKFHGDISNLSLNELKSGERAAQEAQTSFKNEMNRLQDEMNRLQGLQENLNALQKQFNAKRDSGLYDASLYGQIEAIKKEMAEAAPKIEQAKGQLQRYAAIEQQFHNAAMQRQKELASAKKEGGSNGPPDDPEEATKKNLAALKKLTDAQADAREKLKLQLQQSALDQQKAGEQQLAQFTGTGDKLADQAEIVATKLMHTHTTGWCLKGVADAYARAFPGETPLAGAERAYQAVEKMAKNPRFKEVQVTDQQMANLPRGTVVVWEKGRSASGHISVADGQGYELSDHKQKQMIQHYGGGDRHVFMPVGSSGDFLATQAEAQASIKQQQLLQQQLTELLAVQAKYTSGSKEREQVDKEIQKLENDITQTGIDATKSRMKAQKELNVYLLAQANSELDYNTAMAQAKAASTADGLDDIKASYTSTINEIQKAENANVIYSKSGEAEKAKWTALYAEQRKAAEKAYTDAVQEYNDQAQKRVNDILFAGQREDIEGLQDSLQKRIALVDLERDQRIQNDKDQLAALKKAGKERTAEYELIEHDITDAQKVADDKRAKLHLASITERNEATLEARRKELELESQLNKTDDPEKAYRQQLEFGRQKLQLQRDTTTEYRRQLDQAIEKAKADGQDVDQVEAVIQLRKKVHDSLDQELLKQQQISNTVIDRLKQEAELRKQISDEIVSSLGALGKMVGMDGAGGAAGGILDALNKGLGAFKVQKGWGDTAHTESASILDMLSVNGQGGMAGADALSEATLDPSGIIAIVGAAQQLQDKLKETLTGIADWAIKSFWVIPWVIPAELDKALNESKEQTEQANLELRKTELDTLKLQLNDQTLVGAKRVALVQEIQTKEKQLIMDQARWKQREIDRQANDEAIQVYLQYGAGSQQDQLVQEIWDRAATHREQVNAQAIAEIERQEMEHILRMQQMLADYQSQQRQDDLNNAQQQARLTPTKMDDFNAEQATRWAQAADAYDKKMKTIQTLLDEAGIGTKAEDTDAGKKAAANLASNWEFILRDIGKKKSDYLTSLTEDAQKKDEQAALLTAQTTDDQFDDIEVKYKNMYAQRERDRKKDLENVDLTDKERRQINAYYDALEIKDKQDKAKEIADIRKKSLADADTDYRDALQHQRQMIQEELTSDIKAWQDKIEAKQVHLKALQQELEDSRKELEKLQEQRQAELDPWKQRNNLKNPEFNQKLNALDVNSIAWQGVDVLSNVDNRAGLDNVSTETQYRGLVKQADVMEKSAQYKLDRESISIQDYVDQMQKAQLVRAKAASIRLDTEQLTTDEELQLQQEWSDAYVKYQDLATQAINDRYDSLEETVNKTMTSQQKEIDSTQVQISTYQDKITALQKSAQADFDKIDSALLTLDQSTRGWGSAWNDVTEGIDRARAAWERAKAAGLANANGAGSDGNASDYVSPGAYYSVPTGRSREQSNEYPVPGPDDYYYPTTAAMYAANGMADGGFMPDVGSFGSDQYGPFMLDRKEAVVPFDKWPEILRPFMPPESAFGGGGFHIEITNTGNYIGSDVDMYNTSYRAAQDALMEFQRDISSETGRWT